MKYISMFKGREEGADKEIEINVSKIKIYFYNKILIFS